MNKTAEFVAGAAVAMAAWTGEASAQSPQMNTALDTSLRAAVERKDVPGVATLVTDRDHVLYRSAFGVADVSTAFK